MTEAVDCATTQMEAEEPGEDGQEEEEAAESTSASKMMQFQVMQLFLLDFFFQIYLF